MDPDVANLIARLNSIPVSLEDLVDASNEIHNLPAAQRDWEGRATCVVRLFRGEHYKAFAVTSRLEAMADLIASGKLPQGLAPETSDGGRLIAAPMFQAAAQEPLLFTEQHACFNAESFIAAVLRHSDVEGHA